MLPLGLCLKFATTWRLTVPAAVRRVVRGFGYWAARAKVTRAIARLGQGKISNVKCVGEGVLEYRIDLGPGYRVYFGRDGETLVILLTGGTKKRQQRDIDRGESPLAGLQAARRGPH